MPGVFAWGGGEVVSRNRRDLWRPPENPLFPLGRKKWVSGVGVGGLVPQGAAQFHLGFSAVSRLTKFVTGLQSWPLARLFPSFRNHQFRDVRSFVPVNLIAKSNAVRNTALWPKPAPTQAVSN